MRRLVDSLNSNVFASQIDGDVYLLAAIAMKSVIYSISGG